MTGLGANVFWRFSFRRAPKPPSAESREADTFFSELDRFQRQAFASLRRNYPGPENDAFCKLLALKIANAFAADYHFRNRHALLVSSPVQLQMDPTNSCNLRCPSCLHSANADWASRFDWPKATLSLEEFDKFCRRFGPCAINIALFRDGDPLLHRRFPEFVKIAKGYNLCTLASTNLSVPFDVDALVASGLDRLVAAIDGGSAGTYARYRRGGDFALVLENLRAIVRARKKQSSLKPWLVWEFLAFEHNVQEIEAARDLARETGVDQFSVARPHSVAHDDPAIRVAEDAPAYEVLFTDARNWFTAGARRAATVNAEVIEAVFQETWKRRLSATGKLKEESTARGQTCNWLYCSLTMDAARRVTPCCLPPMGPPEPRHLVYARFNGQKPGEILNSDDFVRARGSCRGGPEPKNGFQGKIPFCIACTEKPQMPMPSDVAAYLTSVDERRALPPNTHAALSACPLFVWAP
jgi:hypothetical protein